MLLGDNNDDSQSGLTLWSEEFFVDFGVLLLDSYMYLLQEVNPLTDAAKSNVEQKMDNMNGVYSEPSTS